MKKYPKYDAIVKHKETGWETTLPYNRDHEDMSESEIKADVEQKHSYFKFVKVVKA